MKRIGENKIFLPLALFAEFFLMYILKERFWILFLAMLVTLFYGTARTLKISINKREVIANFQYFILPFSYFLGFIFFLTIIQSYFAQLVLVIFFSISNIFLLRGIMRLRGGRDKPLTTSRNILSMIGLVTIFFALVDLSNIALFYKMPVYLLMLFVFAAVWIITYFLYWQYREIERDSILYITIISFVLTEFSWSGSFWTTSYPSFETGKLGVPVFSLISLLVYYCFWGIAHHKLEENLSKKVLLEYIMISAIIISIILFTTNWFPEGITL